LLLLLLLPCRRSVVFAVPGGRAMYKVKIAEFAEIAHSKVQAGARRFSMLG
jgi:hypothetical protein